MIFGTRLRTASRHFRFLRVWETHLDLEIVGKEYYEFRERADGAERRGDDQDLQPLPRPVRGRRRHRRASQAARSHGSSRPHRLRLDRRPQPTASSCSTTRSTRRHGATRRSLTATAGPTTSATRSWPAYWNSTPNAPPKKSRAGTHQAQGSQERPAIPRPSAPRLSKGNPAVRYPLGHRPLERSRWWRMRRWRQSTSRRGCPWNPSSSTWS